MEFYKTANKYLKTLQINFSHEFFQNRMQSHPNYPSLISFTDTLDEIGIKYFAVLADKDKYEELTYPLLAYCSTNGKDDFVLIQNSENFEKQNFGLLNKWSGVAIMIPSNQIIKHSVHAQSLKKEKKLNKIIYCSIAVLFILVLSPLIDQFNLFNIALFLENIVGVFICSLIIMQGMGKENSITEHLCSSDGKEGCEKVMKSKINTINKIFGLGDVGLIYFSGICLYVVLSSIVKWTTEQSAYQLLAMPFILSILFSLVSIYFQWRVLKSWCRLCLLVIGTIFLEAITFFSHYSFFSLSPTVNDIFFFSSMFIIPSIIWLLIKPLILQSEELNKTKISLSRWKRNPDVFLSLLTIQKQVDITPWEYEIILGNPDAINKIIVVANLFCGPCAIAHKSLEEMLNKHFQEISITFRFVVNPNGVNDKRSFALEHILEVFFKVSENKKSEVLEKWFQFMDLEKFAKIYKIENIKNDWFNVLNKHFEWSEASKIKATPALFFNNYQLPNNYTIEDLKLLLPLLIEITESVSESSFI